MRRLLGALGPLLLFGSAVIGQTLNSSQPLGAIPPPTAPFVAGVPSRCAWTVAVQNVPLPPPPPGGAAPVDNRIVEVDTTRVDDLRRDVITYGDNRSEERWFVGNAVFWTPPRQPVDAAKVGPLDSKDPYPSVPRGFPGVGWVGLADYDAVVRFEGTTCYHYATPSQEVWIDAQTRLPVAYRSLGGLYRFTFAAPPDGPLLPPPDYQGAMDQYRKIASHITPAP